MSALDIACARSARERFLAALACPELHMSMPQCANNVPSFLAWVRSRHSTMYHVALSWSQLHLFEFQSAVDPFSTVDITLWECDNACAIVDRGMGVDRLIECFPKLQSIELCTPSP